MEDKKINILWSVSLVVIGIATIILSGFSLVNIKLPDIVIRILGLLDLIALFVLTFSTVKKIKNKE